MRRVFLRGSPTIVSRHVNAESLPIPHMRAYVVLVYVSAEHTDWPRVFSARIGLVAC